MTIVYNKSSSDKNLIILHDIFSKGIIKEIGLKGFMVLSYLLYESRGSTDLSTNITNIAKYTNTKTVLTIIGHLKKLEDNNLITVTPDKLPIGRRTNLYVDLSNYYSVKGFVPVPANIFMDNYENLDEYSWAVFCLLAKKYHPDYNNAMVSKAEMLDILGISKKKRLNDSIKELIDLKLISIKALSKHYVNSENVKYENNKKLGSTKTKYSVRYRTKV